MTTRKKVHIEIEHDFVVDTVEKHKNTESWIVPLCIHNVFIPMKLDTGSDVNILPIKDYTSHPNRPNESETYHLQWGRSFCNRISDFESETQGTLKEGIVCHLPRINSAYIGKRVLAVEQAVDKDAPDIVEENKDLFR